MDIHERPFENIVSLDISLFNDPLKGMAKLDELKDSLHRESRRLESIVLLSGIDDKDKLRYVSLILDDLIDNYYEYYKQAKNMEHSTLEWSRAFLLKQAIVKVIDVIGRRLQLQFNCDYIEGKEYRYNLFLGNSCSNVKMLLKPEDFIEVDLINLMKVSNDINSGKVDKYLKKCDMRFEKKYDDKKLKAIFEYLKDKSYIDEYTQLDNFLYLLGNNDNFPKCYERINWISSLKSLYVWIDTFYKSDYRRWKKTPECFVINCEQINDRSLSTAVSKHDDVEELEMLFKSWREE